MSTATRPTWAERRKAKKVQRLRDRIEDRREYLSTWSWSFPPSERRRAYERLDAMETKVREMEGDSDD